VIITGRDKAKLDQAVENIRSSGGAHVSGVLADATTEEGAAALDCGVADELSAFLLGHIPEGMSAKYALRRMLLEGRTLRRHQRTISRRVLELLGTDLTFSAAP
jgi:hypothetical protein